MGLVTTSVLPEESQLYAWVTESDFLDCYSIESAMPPRKAAEIITSFPGWTQTLLKIRTVLVAPFGISAHGPESSDKLGIFPVVSETSDELILGFDDKHLDFRISVKSKGNRLYLATWVHTHNLVGRIYLKAIMPFHVLIIRNSLTRVKAAETFDL